ncbi:MMPL family transporter [Rothia uropygioeca]|uniref:MMPL family transporter n=1 Tax=Kocuria sp. 257 TaxID=2021970 RepID=UPI001012CC4A|nr:MMPL family transporter [Kocuria sp. 257]
MASLLYKIGRFCARKAWLVLVVWLVALAAAGGSFAAYGGQLSNAFSLPGSETERLQNLLKDKVPDASHGMGQAVVSTKDGKPFTESQKSELADALSDAGKVDGVASTTDPFQTQSSLKDSKSQLDDAARKIEGAWRQLGDGQKQLDDGYQQLSQGQTKLDEAAKQASGAPDPGSAQGQLESEQQKLDDQRKTLDGKKDELDKSRDQLRDQQREYDRNLKLFKLSESAAMVSTDGSTAIASISFDETEQNISQETKDSLRQTIDDAGIRGVDINYSQSIAQDLGALAGPSEIIGVVIALVVLLIMLGTIIAAGLPLVTALIGVGIGVLITMALSSVIEIQQITPMLGLMLGLAVGIDYSLFILNRHRVNLRQGHALSQSIALANGTSGNAVVFAGTTVIVALLALNVVGIPFLGIMGTTAAMCVLIAVLVSVTLTPALLGIIKLHVLNKNERATYNGHAGKHVHPKRLDEPRGWAKTVTRHPVLVILGAIVVLGIIAIPTASMRLGLPDASTESVDSTDYKAYKQVEDKFGAGANGTILVVAELPSDTDQTAAQDLQIKLAEKIQDQDDVKTVVPGPIAEDESVEVFQVTPDEGPAAESTEKLVNSLRDLSSDTEAQDHVTLGVTGQTGGNIDISQILSKALPGYIGIVLGLSFLIMVLVFRSILVPLIATLGFLFSLLASFGGVVAIYQWGWLGQIFQVHDASIVLSFLPTLAVGILFGLAMDYQMFLVSGMREAYAHGAPARKAVIMGYNQSARVVVAAAIIMFSVFGGFVFSELTMIRPIGFGLAFGVLLDAFVIRMTLIPAAMHLLGEAAWWMPRWLEKILPNVDVEGASLERKTQEDRQ